MCMHSRFQTLIVGLLQLGSLTLPLLSSAASHRLQAADPPDRLEQAQKWLQDAERAASAHRGDQVIELTTRILDQTERLPSAYYWRGRERLRQGNILPALADFDALIERQPSLRKRLWERGIAAYYAEKYEIGAAQFAAYQHVDGADVENAVWHCLCRARQTSWEEARRTILAVGPDPRIPMNEIYRLFRGEVDESTVVTAAENASGSTTERQHRLFYAHLYVGLYFEARSDRPRAEHHLRQAVERYKIGDYMYDIARMHVGRWDRAPATQTAAEPTTQKSP